MACFAHNTRTDKFLPSDLSTFSLKFLVTVYSIFSVLMPIRSKHRFNLRVYFFELTTPPKPFDRF